MKKFTQKEINNLLKDVENTFTKLIEAIIYYEINEKDDFATDIIGYIENLSNLKELELLLKDFPNRKNEDFDIYGYQKLWLALINTQDKQCLDILKEEIQKNSVLKMFLSTIISDYDDENETKNNVLKLLENNLTIRKFKLVNFYLEHQNQAQKFLQ